MKWSLLPLIFDDDKKYRTAVRLNSLASHFFFTRHTLKRHRLARFHYECMSMSLERDNVQLGLECPRRHFKSTCATEAYAIWRALPFTVNDELLMRAAGMDDAYIAWMKRCHNQNIRILIVTETGDNAAIMAKNVDNHYYNNSLFRAAFTDILPGPDAVWNEKAKYQKRTMDRAEATFTYRGVGQAVQSQHFDLIIEDDLVGRDAIKSEIVMQDTIDYHCLLTGVYDTEPMEDAEGNRISVADKIDEELIVGNRWSHDDMNTWIRVHEPSFKWETHDAEGGCCKKHPQHGIPIFPEEWSMEKLARYRIRLGPWNYSHQMRNVSMLPEEQIFKPEWLKYFRYQASRPDLPLEDLRNVLMIQHEVQGGETIPDIEAGSLSLRMIVDLAHAKKKKRANHVILIVGYDAETQRIYICEVWAKATGYGELVDKFYELAEKWGLRSAYMELVAAQNLMEFYIKEKNSRVKWPVHVIELPYDNSANAKKNRIEATEPLFRNFNVFCHRSQDAFISEYLAYPASTTVDVLDTFGYVPQTLDSTSNNDVISFLQKQNQTFRERRASITGW